MALVILRPEFVRFQEYRASITTWLVSAAAADIFITYRLVWSLVCQFRLSE